MGFTQEDLRILNCLGFDEFIIMMKNLGLEHEGYIEEKFDSCKRNIGHFLMELDFNRFEGVLSYCRQKKNR